MKSNVEEIIASLDLDTDERAKLNAEIVEENHSAGLYNLPVLRKSRHLTLKALARRLDTSENSVWHIERTVKKGQPILSSVVNYLDALGYGITVYATYEDVQYVLLTTDDEKDSNQLRDLRVARGFTQAHVAELMDSNTMNVSNMERTAMSELSMKNVFPYVDALDMEVTVEFQDIGDPGDKYVAARDENKRIHSLGELRKGVIQEKIGQELNMTAGRISHRERSTIGQLPVKFVANYLSAIGYELTMNITSRDGSLYEIVHDDDDNFTIVAAQENKS